jgi:poly-gamma-glutamate synthesis protein (capsule biosynthesis protein)
MGSFGFVAVFLLITCRLESQTNSEKGTTKILFVGDVMLDNGPGHVIASGRDPFQACQSLFEGVDLSIANLECVLGRGGEQLLKNYVFRGAIDSPRHLKKYFHAVSLANNHSGDYGPEGLAEMLTVLERERIAYFGAGRNPEEAMRPFVFSCKGHKIAILGFNEFNSGFYAAKPGIPGNAPLDEAGVTSAIKHAREKLGCDIVIPFLHWGEEMWPEPRADQRQMARRWIDAGASAVIGAHPHVTQTVEYHRGRPIIYSLGNFVFDYFPPDPPEWTGWVAILEFDATGTIDLQLRSVTLDAAGCPSITSSDR